MARITPTNVINRLRTLGSLDETITSDLLNDLSYIPAAEAEVDDLMEVNEITYSELSSSKQILVQTLEVLIVCKTCMSPALEENLQSTEATKDKGVMYQDRAISIRTINEQISTLKKRLGLVKLAET